MPTKEDRVIETNHLRHTIFKTPSQSPRLQEAREKALDQPINDKEFFITLDEEGNSVAVIMKHMAGNMFSRWTDF